MKTKTKGCLIIAGAFAGILVLAALALAVGYPLYAAHARREWKEQAIPEIARLAGDREWIAREIIRLKLAAKAEKPGPLRGENGIGWLTDHMILMRNGEWLVYRNHCSKQSPHTVKDIFLAKGSNGKWYYTTCHFCVGMYALILMQSELPENQPATLAAFAKRYHLREFDGHSDACLQTTMTSPANP